jgi:hypothetical protein
VEIPAAGHDGAQVLAALAVERHHLAVQDRLLDRQFLPHPVAELLKPLEDASPLGPEMTAFPGDVEQPPIAVVPGFEKPGGIVERLTLRGE